MRKIRVSIARLMGAVLIAAVGFAALRNLSDAWAGLMLMLTCGVLLMGVVGAVCQGPHERAWWLGFALFGFGYLALTFGKSQLFTDAPHLPTEGILNGLLRPGGPPIHSHFPDFTTPGDTRVRNDVIMRKLAPRARFILTRSSTNVP